MSAPNLSALVQRFFTERLPSQLGASRHTVASYRDSFRLLLVFASERLARKPSQLRTEDLDAALIGAFLDYLEHGRASTPKTRNVRLAAVRSFFRFVSYAEPACSLQCQQVLAIPNKRHERSTVEFLTEPEMTALLAAPDVSTWIGRRDRACCSWQYRPAYATPSSALFDATTCNLAPAHTCAASAKGVKPAALLCDVTWPLHSRHGSSNRVPDPTIRSSRAHVAAF